MPGTGYLSLYVGVHSYLAHCGLDRGGHRPAGGTRPGPDGRARDHGSRGRRVLRRGLPAEPRVPPQRVAVRAAPVGHHRLDHRLDHRPADLADLRQARARTPRLTRAWTADAAGPGPGPAGAHQSPGCPLGETRHVREDARLTLAPKSAPGAGALLCATNMR